LPSLTITDKSRLVAAVVLPELKDPQQHGLYLGGQLSNLVEEQRAAIGLTEQAFGVFICSGKCTLDVAEKLTDDGTLLERSTVDTDHLPVAEFTIEVDILGQGFFARTRLPLDQYGPIVEGVPRRTFQGLGQPA